MRQLQFVCNAVAEAQQWMSWLIVYTTI